MDFLKAVLDRKKKEKIGRKKDKREAKEESCAFLLIAQCGLEKSAESIGIGRGNYK